jgi:spermidine synthase
MVVEMSPGKEVATAGHRRVVLAAVVALGVSCVMTQLALMRELLAAFSGNEMTLGIVLGLWLLLMGIGTWLGRLCDRLRNPVACLVIAQMLVAILPLFQVLMLRGLRNVVFMRGAAVGVVETVASTTVLLSPYCLVAGFALTLASSLLARAEGPVGIGCVYVADSVGGIFGGLLFSFILVRFLDHFSILVLPALLNLSVALAVGLSARAAVAAERFGSDTAAAKQVGTRWAVGGAWASLCGLAAVLAAAVLGVAMLANADALSTAWQYPHQHIVARTNSPYGKLIVTEAYGQFSFFENGLPILSTHDDQHIEETVHYVMAQRPEVRRVLLVSGGISGTAKELLKYGPQSVDYVELDPRILEFGRKYMPENLADSRLRIINTDGRLFIRRTGERYDVVIIDVPDPSTAQLNRFYTAEFFAEVKRALATNGVVSFSLGHYENYISPELARMLASACLSLAPSFRNLRVIPGSRICFVASDGPLFDDIAARLEQRQIQTKLVNRHYLDAMLTADRLAEVAQATTQPAAINEDFSPMLYYYHLRHWMSQFQAGFGVLQVSLLGLLSLYLARLRGAAFVLFASGFAASALETVLLLAFQVLCGSVYHQVGIIVTAFMVGLVVGAQVMNLLLPQGRWKTLALLAASVGAYALLLLPSLFLLNRAGETAGALVAVKAAIILLTFVLAVLVGMQFPLANRLAFDGSAATPSGLYTADFAGAFLGALLSSTLLIPLIGVKGVCLLTAGLNLLAGAITRFRKATT